MKIITIFLTLISITVLVFQSCKKDEDKINQPPTCQITAPISDQEIAKGDTVIITIEANDNDGNIAEVRYAIDGIGKGFVSSYPFNYSWTTNNESIGTHIIKATSVDNNGGNTSDEISIKITEDNGIGTFTDPRDGQTYSTIDIGNQTWFSENLNYETPTNSYLYDNNSANSYFYGRLYTWRAALSACPVGWHLPSDDEWKIMEMALGMSQSEANKIGYRGTDEGEKMKSIGGWSGNGNGTNSSGFNALPGGFREDWDFFSSLYGSAYFWSSTLHGSDAIRRSNHRSSSIKDKVGRIYCNRNYCFSVRCLQD